MKRYPVSAEDQMEEALLLLKRIGDALQHPMVVIRYDNTIPYANPHFLAFTTDLGPGFLIRSVDQVEKLLPDQQMLSPVWQTGEPCTAQVNLQRASGTIAMICDCIPFVNVHQRVALVTIIYRTNTGAGSVPPGILGRPSSGESRTAAWDRSCREFGEILERFSRGHLDKTNPPMADDPLAELKRKFNDGIDRVQKMISVKGLFG